MHLKRYLKMCNMFVLLLLLMMGNGGGGSKKKQESIGIDIGGEDERKRRSRPAGMTVPGNRHIPPSSQNLATPISIIIIPAEAPFPLPTSDLESHIEMSPLTSHKRENSRTGSLTVVNT